MKLSALSESDRRSPFVLRPHFVVALIYYSLMAELKIKADRVDEVQAENVKYMRLLDESQKEVERLRSENARLQAQLGLQRLPVKNLFSEF